MIEIVICPYVWAEFHSHVLCTTFVFHALSACAFPPSSLLLSPAKINTTPEKSIMSLNYHQQVLLAHVIADGTMCASFTSNHYIQIIRHCVPLIFGSILILHKDVHIWLFTVAFILVVYDNYKESSQNLFQIYGTTSIGHVTLFAHQYCRYLSKCNYMK